MEERLDLQSEVLGVFRYTLARWANGETEPAAAIPILFALRAMADEVV